MVLELDHFLSDKPKIKKNRKKKNKNLMISQVYMKSYICIKELLFEFGSGWSSLVIAHTLKFLKKYSIKVKKDKKSNPFELFILKMRDI